MEQSVCNLHTNCPQSLKFELISEVRKIPGCPAVDGEEPKAGIPGYRFVGTKKLPNGDTEHAHEKVTTSYVDENGDQLRYPTEEWEQPEES